MRTPVSHDRRRGNAVTPSRPPGAYSFHQNLFSLRVSHWDNREGRQEVWGNKKKTLVSVIKCRRYGFCSTGCRIDSYLCFGVGIGFKKEGKSGREA